ncbi:MAG: DUF4037 domain-containing protein [Mailhella sp.]|nr:DUF4037 domain-containing protein [Mailhella sp.]
MSESGLALSRRFFQASLPLLNDCLPDVMACAAAGLAGEGSECLGVDDAVSRDHDWGPAFCLWIPDELLLKERTRIEAAMALLPKSFEGFPVRMSPERRMGRVGPLPLRGFYRNFLGLDHAPQTWKEWRSIPEYHLCSCTNGAVFMDNLGEFSAMREALLAYYPEDVRRKKIAARCMVMAQTGQYNLPRALQRGELVTAMLAAARFAEAALSMAFLLNRRFMPFYKWTARLATDLPILGRETVDVARKLSRTAWDHEAQGMDAVGRIEELCAQVAEKLRSLGLTDEPGDWLWTLGPSVQKGIHDLELRRLNVMED